MPVKPGSSKRKTHRAIFDARALGSLIAPELLDEDLKGRVKKSTKKSKWKTGMNEFSSEGTAKINKEMCPSFATQRQLDIKLNLLLRQENHSHRIVVGMRDLKRLGIAIHSKEETMK